MASIFQRAESTSAYLKMGILGFAGSGKTWTATQVAIGLTQHAKKRKLPQGDKPIFFIDTECGSDFVTPTVREAGLEIFTAKTRAFSDLIPAVNEAEKNASVLIIDSITHFWREFCDAYMRKKNRSRLEFQDWAVLKSDWGKFTDRYVNSAAHIILNGRAGYEYEDEKDEVTGKRTIHKSGIKMRAETEMGYEPSLLVLMERAMDMETKKVFREAHILKERFGVIDGMTFENPTYESFMPHIERLNLGGIQLGVDTSRSSDEMFGDDGELKTMRRKRAVEVALEEVEAEIVKMFPGMDKDSKAAKAELLEELFGTRSWTAVTTKRLEDLQSARNRLWLKSRGHAYGEQPASEIKLELIDDTMPESVVGSATVGEAAPWEEAPLPEVQS